MTINEARSRLRMVAMELGDDLKEQFRRDPWPALAGALMVGVVIGAFPQLGKLALQAVKFAASAPGAAQESDRQ